jgi:GAF domain-containing protein
LKIYRSARELLGEIKQIIADNRPGFHCSPLEKVIDVLSRGRRYTWAAIYLTAGNTASQRLLGASGDPHPAQLARPETRSKVLVSIRIAGRELGVLDVESDRDNAFGSADRVLLETVADLLARFLAGPGKYLVLKARSLAAPPAAVSR